MKKQFMLAALCVFFISSAFTADKKENLRQSVSQDVAGTFDSFRIHRQTKDGVTATWSFSSGGTVTGFILERTYEDPTDPYANWEVAGTTPSTGSRSYKITDDGVFPGFISYRVIATMSTGEEISSDIETIHIISH